MEVRGDARPWLMACGKAHGQLSFRVNWSFFRYLLWFRSYEAKIIYSSAVSQRVDVLALKFYLDRVVPHQLFLAAEN